MGIMYKCSQCEQKKDSAIDGVTVIQNLHRDDEVICDDCMYDIADRVRDDLTDFNMENN